MNKPLIGGVVLATTIAAGAIFFHNKDDLFPVPDSVNEIINDYKLFFEEVSDENAAKNMSNLCKNRSEFNKKIKELEDHLKHLQQRKLEYLSQATQEMMEIEEKRQEKLAQKRKHVGAACPKDYDGTVMLPGSWELDLDGNFIPPDHWPRDENNKVIPPPDWPLDNEGSPLPPGICARDYNGEVMLPGSWGSDLDGNFIPPDHWPRDVNNKVIPPPGWPLDADGEPLFPGSLEFPRGYAPDRFDNNDPPELIVEEEIEKEIEPGKAIENNIAEIGNLEELIKINLEYLSSLCDKKEEVVQQKEKIPSDCMSACQKIAQCSLVGGGSEEDKADDYKICMEECISWKEETRICINKRKPLNYQECSFITLCIGQEEKYHKGYAPKGYTVD